MKNAVNTIEYVRSIRELASEIVEMVENQSHRKYAEQILEECRADVLRIDDELAEIHYAVEADEEIEETPVSSANQP